MADISKIKTLDGTTYDLKDTVARNGKVPAGIMEILNPFAPEQNQKLYIDRLENALYFADKRWTVTGTVTSSAGASTSLSTTQIANLFDMGEENMSIPPAGGTLVLTLDFTGSDGTSVFPNYPYGILCLDFYYAAGPQSVSARVYGKHTGTTSFWQNLTVTADSNNTASNIRYKANQTGMYNMQKLEITVVAKSDAAASLSDISYYLTRANKDKDMPYVSKLRAEKLYYTLTAPSFIGDLTGKVNNHTVNSDVPSGAKFTDTTYTATTSKLVTTTVPNVTSVGSAPTLGTAIDADDITAWSAGSTPTLGTAIDADDITAWTANTPTSASVSNGVLVISAGSAASLSYTAKSIPNVTSVGSVPSLSYTARSIPNVTSVGSAPTLGTAVTVATGSLAANGGGATVATGITAS